MEVGSVAPTVILRGGSAVHDVKFVGAGKLLSGSGRGEVVVWDLADRRPAATWRCSEGAVLAVHGIGSAYLSQGKDGWMKLWDAGAEEAGWQVRTDCASFARSLVLPRAGGDPLDADARDCIVCSPLCEPHIIGVFDCRVAEKQFELTLSQSAASHKKGSHTGANPLGMCMALDSIPALGPTYMFAAYESTDVCVWDLRSPQEPVFPSIVAGDPNSPAICATVIWKQAWIACANGDINAVRFRKGAVQLAAGVESAPAPYAQQRGEGVDDWQAQKGGVNVLAVRQDLRLVAAARWDKRVEFLDTKTATSLGRLQCHDGGVLCAAFDRERGALATGSDDGHIALWGALSETYAGPVEVSRLPTIEQ